jgi:hypothetical protein
VKGKPNKAGVAVLGRAEHASTKNWRQVQSRALFSSIGVLRIKENHNKGKATS